MKITIFVSILIITLAIPTLAGADAPVLTIDSVEGTKGILTINYTVVDKRTNLTLASTFRMFVKAKITSPERRCEDVNRGNKR